MGKSITSMTQHAELHNTIVNPYDTAQVVYQNPTPNIIKPHLFIFLIFFKSFFLTLLTHRLECKI